MSDRWYFKVGDNVVGPVDKGELLKAVKTGDLKSTSRVRFGENGPWGPASLIPGLWSPATASLPTIEPNDLLDELDFPIPAQPSPPLGNVIPTRPQPKSKGSKPAQGLQVWQVATVSVSALCVLLIVLLVVLQLNGPAAGPVADNAKNEPAEVAAPHVQTAPKPAQPRPNAKPNTAMPDVTTKPATTNVASGPQPSTLGPTVYLSDLKEIDHEVWEYVPGFGFGKNGTFVDEGKKKQITLAGKTSPKGILAHPKSKGVSRVRYSLKGLKYKYFVATVGVDDTRHYHPASPLVFEVWVDQNLLWSSKPVEHWGEPQECHAVLPELGQFELRVRSQGDAAFAFAVWCEPRLTNEELQSTPPSTVPQSPTELAAAEKKMDLDNGQPKSSSALTPTIPIASVPGNEIVYNRQSVLSPAEVRTLFPSKASGVAFFPVASGLITFDKNGELAGAAIVIGTAKKPKLSLSFARNRRDGLMRCWDDKGMIQYLSGYKKGKKDGITALYIDGKPQLIEIWDTSQVPKRYWVKDGQGAPDAVQLSIIEQAPAASRKEAEERMETLEQEALSQERAWRQSFREWWTKNDGEFKRLNQSLAAAREGGARNNWKQKVEAKARALKQESDRALSNFLSGL